MNAYEAKIRGLGETVDELLNGRMGTAVSELFQEPTGERIGFLLMTFPGGSPAEYCFTSNVGGNPALMVALLRAAADEIARHAPTEGNA